MPWPAQSNKDEKLQGGIKDRERQRKGILRKNTGGETGESGERQEPPPGGGRPRGGGIGRRGEQDRARRRPGRTAGVRGRGAGVILND